MNDLDRLKLPDGELTKEVDTARFKCLGMLQDAQIKHRNKRKAGKEIPWKSEKTGQIKFILNKHD